MGERAPEDGPTAWSRRRLGAHALAVLDGLVAGYTLARVVYIVTGGFDLGVASVRRFSKPFLLLMLLAAVRAAIPRPSWLSRLLAGFVKGTRERVAELQRRTPWAAAALDALVAVVTVHILLKGTTFLSAVVVPAARPRPFPLPFASAKLAATFAAWDSGWYFDIARRGY